MKRFTALALCLVLVLSLCACGKSEPQPQEAAAPQGLQAGYAREKIHPETSVPLGGYGQSEKRMSESALDYLYATCLALKDGDNTILLFSQDLLRSTPTWVQEVRKQINEKLGIPEDHIMICATHTHSGPDTTSSLESIGKYKTLYIKQMIKAAEKAVADLAPATLSGTKTEADLNYIRHYKMNDGSYAGSNFGDWSSGIVDHVRENDPEMRLVKIEREGDKKDILMINWQVHPCNTGGVTKTDISADYIAPMRDKVEAETDLQTIYFLGACGDLGANSLMSSDHHGLEHQEYGEAVAQHVIDALPNLQAISGSGIQTSQVIYEGAVNHDDEHLGVEARQVKDVYDKLGKDPATELAHSLGISSVYHASAILARPSRPATTTMEINAIRIADIGFITAPIEMFSDHGKYIRANSPFDITIIATNSNDAKSYIPTADAYDYGCYESYISIFAKGVGESLADKYVEMLNALK